MNVRASPSLRRRLDNTLLRWQARVDSPWVDRFLPWTIAGVLFVVLASLAFAASDAADETGRFAAALQATWLIAQGHDPIVTVADDAHALAQQFSLVLYPVAWTTRVLPSVGTLVVLQSAALAVAVVPLWRLARGPASLRFGPTAVLVGVYALYPAMHNLNVAGFAAESFALPALLGAAYAALTDRDHWFWLFVAVTVASRADLGLAVAGLGLSLWLVGRIRLGRLALVAGGAWALLAAFVVQPLIGDGTSPHLTAFAEFGDSAAGVVWGMLTQPGDLLSALARERTINLFVVLLGPVLFLPLLAPRLLIGIAPLQFLFLVGDTPEESLFGEQTVAVTAFVFLATAFALSRLGRMGLAKVTVDPRLLVAVVVAGCIFFVQDAASSPYREPWSWGPGDRAATRQDAVMFIEPDDRVRASPSMLTPLAQRQKLYELSPDARPSASALAERVDVVVLDEEQLPGWGSVERRVLELRLDAAGFEELLSGDGIGLWRREGAGGST